MRPNLELSCFDENNVYKYLLYLVQKASFYTQNNIPCALDIFLVLDQLIKKNQTILLYGGYLKFL